MDAHYKHPRLYVDQALGAGKTALLGEGPAHYLKNVLRRDAGAAVRLFNARDGEWLAEIAALDKKSAYITCQSQLREAVGQTRRRHLLFPPLAKDRLDFLVEKAVELGATDLHPITTQQSDIRKINEGRLAAQIIEAAEQCERLDIPALHPVSSLERALAAWDAAIPLYAALERSDAPPLQADSGPAGLLIGPPGGFTDAEKTMLSGLAFVKPVTLTDTILRTETAALYALSALHVR